MWRYAEASGAVHSVWCCKTSRELAFMTLMLLLRLGRPQVTGNSTYRGMTWAMLPSFGGALAACTWHFFYNSPDLYFLVALQASCGCGRGMP